MGWFGRHKLLTLFLALLVLVALGARDEDPADVTADDRAGQEPADRQDRQPDGRGGTEPTEKPPAPRTYLVAYVVDGDTLDLANGETVRLAGIDSPERGECGYEESARNLERLVLGRRVRLAESDEDRDRYGRLLRYVDIGRLDAGLEQIRAGLAVARYDSRDGYGRHPREDRYVAADAASPDPGCGQPKPLGLVGQPPSQDGCAPGYSPCVPAYPPDVDCPDVDGPIRVTGSDPHGLDRDGDGIACE